MVVIRVFPRINPWVGGVIVGIKGHGWESKSYPSPKPASPSLIRLLPRHNAGAWSIGPHPGW